MMLGVLWKAELVQDGRMFYCPSQDPGWDPRLTYNTSSNTWPPLEGTTFCRAGYGTRPSFTWRHFFWPNNFPDLPESLPAHQAMISDYVFGLPSVSNRHVEGVNVAAGGGSCRWVPLEKFSDSLDLLPDFPLVNAGTTYDKVYLSTDETSGLWVDFDN
jgi:hypothetical protein